MKDQEVPTRKGISIFVKPSAKTFEFTERCHLRVQTIRREEDGSYIPLDDKLPELGKALECSSATFAVITRRLPHTIARDFIDYLITEKGFREVTIYHRRKKKRGITAYVPAKADVEEFSPRIIVEFRRYKPDPDNRNKAIYDTAKIVNIAGIPLSRSVASLTRGFFYYMGFKKEFKEYSED